MGSLTALTGDVIYLDANIFIYALEGLPPFAAQLAALFQRFDRGELRAVTSELTLAEVLVKPVRDNNPVVRAQYDQLLRTSPALTVAPITRDLLVAAATLRATSTLKLPDAIHAATALGLGCTTFLTNDRRFTAIQSLPALLASHLP
jgi:predicted nucleic acid-binding protein